MPAPVEAIGVAARPIVMITLIVLLIALLGLQPSLALPAVPPPPTPVQPAATPRARVMLMGDVMLARSVGERIRREGPGAPFRHVKPILDRADLVIANLETVISKRGTRANKLYTFRARPKSVRALRKGGVDIVGLANNHTLDYGRTALRDTIRILDRAGIRSAGAGRDRTAARAPVIVTRNGLRIAFLDRADANLDSYEWPRLRWEATTKRSGLAYARPKQLREDVRAAKRRADVVIVMLHSGREYAKSPTKAQRRVVEAALEGGAALVVSAHPHVLQKGRHRGSTMVAWSLGNFVFDGFETIPGARDSAILDVTLTRQGVASVRWHPVIIRQGFPRPATGADRRRILRTLGVD